jgi:protein-arginine kinase activator protein McsA
MLCEKCQTREASVHVTEIVAESKEMKKHNFCEACFKESHLSKIMKDSGATGWAVGSPPPRRPNNDSGR